MDPTRDTAHLLDTIREVGVQAGQKGWTVHQALDLALDMVKAYDVQLVEEEVEEALLEGYDVGQQTASFDQVVKNGQNRSEINESGQKWSGSGKGGQNFTFSCKKVVKDPDYPGNLLGDVKGIISTYSGAFTAQTIFNDLGINHSAGEIKKKIHTYLSRLREEKIIRKEEGERAGLYRRIEETPSPFNVFTQKPAHTEIHLPLGIGESAKVSAGGTITIAGVTGTGKTTLALEIIRLNLHGPLPIKLLLSEMTEGEYAERVRHLCDPEELELWAEKVDCHPLTTLRYEDEIASNLDGLTVIDYIEPLHGDASKVNLQFSRIAKEYMDKGGSGICLACLQKKTGFEHQFGWGGEGTMHKPRLYVSLDPLVKIDYRRSKIIRISIAKSKLPGLEDLEGKERHVEVIGGKELKPLTEWMYNLKVAQLKRYIANYERKRAQREEELGVPDIDDPESIYLTVQCDDGQERVLRLKTVLQWEREFPHVKVRDQLEELRSWLGKVELKADKWFWQIKSKIKAMQAVKDKEKEKRKSKGGSAADDCPW